MSESPTTERIQQEVNDNDIVLFMKGTPMFPQCGFSASVVQVLSHMGVPFQGFNVLEDTEVHQAIRELADHSAALRQRRIRWRLRHYSRDA